MSAKFSAKPAIRLKTPSGTGDTGHASDDRKGVQSVDRAFEILRIIEAAPGPMSVADIAKAADSAPSKVHHYLVSLVRCQALRQTARGTYDLGSTALGLGLTALSRLDPVERTCEAAEELRDHLGEAVFVAVWGNRGPTIIRYFEGRQPLTVEARAGLVLPVLTSATGRVFLAWGNPAQVNQLLETEAPIPNVEAVRARTRETGLGCVDGELLPRIASLSAPVFSYNSDLSLAVTVLGWSGEFDHDPKGAIGRALRSRCAELSAGFGG